MELDHVVTEGKAEEAEQGGAAVAILNALRGAQKFFPEDKNWAEDEATERFVMQEVIPLLQEARDERGNLGEEWNAVRNMEMLVHDSGRRYLGRSTAYLPVYLQNLNTITSNLMRGLFPSDDYLDVFDRRDGSSKKAKATKTYLQYEFDHIANLRVKMRPFIRQFAGYGTSILKRWYKKDLRYQGKVKKGAGGPSTPLLYNFEEQPYYEGLYVTVRSIFDWYIYPITSNTLDEALMVFEDMDVHRDTVLKMRDSGRWLKDVCEYLLAGGGTQENFASNQAQHRAVANASGELPGRRSANYGSLHTLTEIWTYLQLPNGAYLPGEKIRPVPVKVVVADGRVLEVRRNPNFDQKAPYEEARLNTRPGFFYGRGFGSTVQAMQYLANDFANQTNDCGSYTLNPILKVNPVELVGPLTPMRPGAPFYTTNPDKGIVFDRPPGDIIQYGIQLINTYVGMSKDFGGAPPILQGASGGQAGRTATQAQLQQRNASLPLQDIVGDVELNTMVSLMRATWMLGLQYRDQKILALAAGQPIEIDKEMLLLDADFRWCASSQAVNQWQRAQQSMQMLQLAISPPMLQQLMQNGLTVNPAPLMEKLYTDGFGFRGFEQFVVPIPQAPGVPGMPPGPSGPPGSGAPPPGASPPGAPLPGDRVRSAVEQVGGEPGFAAPGEGEDFMQVRDEADAMAAMMGGEEAF
jgi:hypothetical protein